MYFGIFCEAIRLRIAEKLPFLFPPAVFNGRAVRLAENQTFSWATRRVRDADLAPSVALGDFWNYSFLTRADRWHPKLLKTKVNDAAVAIYLHWRKSISKSN